MIPQINSHKYFLLLILLSFLFISCSSSSALLQHPTTSATLWVQNAAEYDALTTMVYHTASSNLALASEDSFWDAMAERKDSSYRKLPPAIIVDVDETVLDNSAFQARMIRQNRDFDIAQWNEWVMEAQADAIHGALEFLNGASQRGITVFYVTNREAEVEDGTRINLHELGFPLDDEKDLILSNNEKDSWTSAKTERRAFIAENYRVLMIFGDDLNDFISAKNITQKERTEIVNKHNKKWGRKWYILPNPVYGSWESALDDFNESLTAEEINAVRESSLDAKE